jgi:hypothetical protein
MQPPSVIQKRWRRNNPKFGKLGCGATFRGMRRPGSPSGQPAVVEPSPPFAHVSWREEREEVVHDAADDLVVLAESVMGREGGDPRPERCPAHLAKIVQYPLWAISVRAAIAAAVIPVLLFGYGGTRYHYLAQAGGRYRFDQDALLAGVSLALVGVLAGVVVGSLWGLLVVRYARGRVRRY